MSEMKWKLKGKRMIIQLDNCVGQYEATGELHRMNDVLQCPDCRKVVMVDSSILYDYCPHCGERMVVHEEGGIT